MKFRYEVVLAMGVLALGISANTVAGQGASRHCTSEECACEEALNKNTVEALENFLRKYPHSARGNSACAAIAVPPGDDGVNPEGQSHDQSDQPNAPAPVPSEG